jgi:hypothetical protein
MEKVRVRLTKKFANMIDGVDLSRYMVGQTMRVPPAEARLLIAEGWAEPVAQRERSVNRRSVPMTEPEPFSPTEAM